MPILHSAHFGPIEYAPESLVAFPFGLPAFESERLFIRLRLPQHEPLISLQSATTPQLAFLTVAVDRLIADYQLELGEEDLSFLGGSDEISAYEVLAIVAVNSDGQVTANVQAPIVIHRQRRIAIQVIQRNPAYKCHHLMGLDVAGQPVSGTTRISGGDVPCS